jgi:uncharacterized protein with PIN domain
MPKLACPDCNRDVAMHELDTQTVAQREGFETTYRCPFCRADIDDVGELLA